MINFFYEEVDKPNIKLRITKKWIKEIVGYYNFVIGDLNFIFCSDNYILDINNKYLSHNYFTDIITFNYNVDVSISGDIFISLETVKENSLEYSVTFEDELKRVIIHGIFHLLGFDDQTDDQKLYMRELENNALLQYPT